MTFRLQSSSKYPLGSDDDILLRRFTDRADRDSEWTSMSTSWIAKTSADERHSPLAPVGLRALFEVLPRSRAFMLLVNAASSFSLS